MTIYHKFYNTALIILQVKGHSALPGKQRAVLFKIGLCDLGALNWTVVVKRELSHKAKLSIYKSI